MRNKRGQICKVGQVGATGALTTSCCADIEGMFWLRAPRELRDLLIVVFAPGLRKTIAPCPGSGGPVGVECGVNSISNAPRSDRMPITCKSTIRRRSRADS